MLRAQETPWDDPVAAALRDAQQAEITALYDHVDPGWDMTGESVVGFVVVHDEDEPVACGALCAVDELTEELGPATGELKRMYVVPAARGHHVSRLVLAWLEDRARALGFARLVLETGPRQPAALALYASAGYRRIPNYGEYADLDDSICLAKELGPR